jgi:hypothetical protein
LHGCTPAGEAYHRWRIEKSIAREVIENMELKKSLRKVKISLDKFL